MTTWKLLLFLIISTVTLAQTLINRVQITGPQSSGGCWLKVTNTEEIFDLRTSCKLPTSSDNVTYQTLLKFIKPKASYLINNTYEIRGYRYFKDPLNYKFKQYNFPSLHSSLNTTLQHLSLSGISLPFQEHYKMTLEWQSTSSSWRLLSLNIEHRNPVPDISAPHNYQTQTWLAPLQSGQHSLALRKLAGNGANQQVNLTLELALEDEAKVNPEQCKVIIEEIMPEWLFVDYDELRTLVKYETFDIELPEHFAKQYFFKYTVPFTKFHKLGPQKYIFNYKMRVRYPRPTDDDSYTVQIGLQPNDRITIACEGDDSPIQVKEDLLNDRGHGQMFSGRSKDAKVVTMVTYFFTTIMCIFALRVVKRPSAESSQ